MKSKKLGAMQGNGYHVSKVADFVGLKVDLRVGLINKMYHQQMNSRDTDGYLCGLIVCPNTSSYPNSSSDKSSIGIILALM